MYKIFYSFVMMLTLSFSDTVICDDAHMSNAEFTSCVSEQSEVLEKELEKVYQNFFDTHIEDKTYQLKIKASQKMWKKYRKAELEMAFPHTEDDRYNWTGLSRCYLEYSNTLTQKRIELLKTLDKSIDKSGCTSYKVF
ncbi:MAG: DUF1311 domain-containing protein [Sulfurovum sp.]|nr:DUF1311 domain-containing protein [Sulfurovum sp.]